MEVWTWRARFISGLALESRLHSIDMVSRGKEPTDVAGGVWLPRGLRDSYGQPPGRPGGALGIYRGPSGIFNKHLLFYARRMCLFADFFFLHVRLARYELRHMQRPLIRRHRILFPCDFCAPPVRRCDMHCWNPEPEYDTRVSSPISLLPDTVSLFSIQAKSPPMDQQQRSPATGQYQYCLTARAC